jgi:K+ transporter
LFGRGPSLDSHGGQFYVSAVNWLLMIVTIALTISFKKSINLAATAEKEDSLGG